MQHLMILEFDPETGRTIPVMPDDAAADYSGFTTPPVPLSRLKMAQWRAFRRKLIRQGAHPQIAWYRASARFCS